MCRLPLFSETTMIDTFILFYNVLVIAIVTYNNNKLKEKIGKGEDKKLNHDNK